MLKGLIARPSDLQRVALFLILTMTREPLDDTYTVEVPGLTTRSPGWEPTGISCTAWQPLVRVALHLRPLITDTMRLPSPSPFAVNSAERLDCALRGPPR